MKFKVDEIPSDLRGLNSECLIIPVYTDKPVSKAVKLLDKDSKAGIDLVIKSGDFTAKQGSTLLLPLTNGKKLKRVLLLGLGPHEKASMATARSAIQSALSKLHSSAYANAHLLFDNLLPKKVQATALAQDVAEISVATSYEYTATFGNNKKPSKTLGSLVLLSEHKLNAAVRTGKGIGQGINAARELGNLPGNVCTPRYLGKLAQSLGRKHSKLKTTVLDDKKLEELGMGSLLSVSRGSEEPARLISMEYSGGKAGDKPVVLVGKGITFDTGGISIKSGGGMDEMKFDMCGAASVFGVIEALCANNAKVNVVGLVAAAENMPGSRATKPGDVVTSMSGKTIEVLNTDAEGRLVLCDALSYAAKFKPAAVIDIATLTGACVIALGHHASGLFSNDDALANALLTAGEASGDRAWRLPIWDEYQQQLKSNFADLANIGGRPAGSITAACFLANFAEEYQWAHIDIAGTAWHSGSRKGATGKPVGLLMNYLMNR